MGRQAKGPPGNTNTDQEQNARLTKLEQRMTAVENRATTLEVRLADLTTRVSETEQTIVALTSRAVALEDRVSQNEADIIELQGGPSIPPPVVITTYQPMTGLLHFGITAPVIPPPLPQIITRAPVAAEVVIGI